MGGDEEMDFKVISLWHPVNGEWIRIDQVFDGENIKYFTDGKEEIKHKNFGVRKLDTTQKGDLES